MNNLFGMKKRKDLGFLKTNYEKLTDYDFYKVFLFPKYKLYISGRRANIYLIHFSFGNLSTNFIYSIK